MRAATVLVAVTALAGTTMGLAPSAQATPTTRLTLATVPSAATALPASATTVITSEGRTGTRVKDLQIRLGRLGYTSGTIDGIYDAQVTAAVAKFLAARGFTGDGKVVLEGPWLKLVSLTATAVILRQGDTGAYVKELQGRLRLLGRWPYSVNGTYSWTLTTRVLAFQQAYNLPYSSVFDKATRDRLLQLTYSPKRFDSARYNAGLRPLLPPVSALDSRCRTGRVLCASKNSRVLTWVVNGVPKRTLWARYGSSTYPTREGSFSVYKKKVDVISNIYGTPMPYSMFFSGGQAVHYSSNFARLGYTSASHGCINVKDLTTLKTVYAEVRVGDRVVVYK